MDCVEAWLFVHGEWAKYFLFVALFWASFGAGYYQGRKMAEREALQQLAKIMLEEKAAK
jgi:hypothetical protein